MKKLFMAEQFTPTKCASAEDKAKFANHFVRFVESDFPEHLFPKWFYTRLSMTFGHIAHYNIAGFYSNFFSGHVGKIEFLRRTINWGCPGDPTFTYSDVERVLSAWVRQEGLVEKYKRLAAEELEATEKAELARLQAKYPNP